MQGLPVKGYSNQTPRSVEFVNKNKELEEMVLRQLEALIIGLDADPRWIAIAKTNIEQGFMAMNRAVFKPTRISLSGDPE